MFEFRVKDEYEILNAIDELIELIDRNISVHDNDKQDNEHKQHNHH
jgi:hypothetical protein